MTRKASARLGVAWARRTRPGAARRDLSRARAHRSRVSLRAAAALAVAGLAVSACGSTQLGAAAITSDNRVTSATLTNEVANLASAYKADQAKGIKPQRPAGQEAQQVLTWLLLFDIYDKLAAQQHVYVTPAESRRQLDSLGRIANQNKVTLDQYVSAAGAVPPNLVPQLGRYLAILSKFETRLNGGKPPTAATPQLQGQVAHAQCMAAKDLSVQVNPQFGQFDYRTYAVVPVPPRLAADPVPSPTTSKALVNPPC
ncbi:MAG TPA: hypothetical protein VLM11_06820 [Streptosporangiaceae bacterium]|nr:hypothetical protein [Streptosporangiaceae bacterium]